MRQLGEQVSSRFGLHGESREGPRDTSLAMRPSCQTRALTLDACGQGTRPDATSVGHGWPSVSEAKDGGRGPCRRAGGKLLFPALLCKRVKAEFGYDDRKGFGACDRGPSLSGSANRTSQLPAERRRWVGNGLWLRQVHLSSQYICMGA